MLKVTKSTLFPSTTLRLQQDWPHRQLNKSIQFLGNTADGFSPSLIIKSSDKYYMFNCGGGFQRILSVRENLDKKINKVNNVFITNFNYSNLEGLPGLCIPTFISDIKNTNLPNIKVYGPPGIKEFLSICKTYTHIFPIIDCIEPSNIQSYSDENINIDVIPLSDSQTAPDNSKRKKTQVLSIAYLCKFQDQKGQLDAKKCKELKVPVGPLLGKLKSGQDITLADGRVIKSSEVCEPSVVGERFLVIDCDTIQNIDTFKKCISSIELKDKIDFVVHLSPSQIIENSRYKMWIETISKRHIYLNSHPKYPTIVDLHKHQYLLNNIDPMLFPKLNHQDEFIVLKSRESSLETCDNDIVIDSQDIYQPSTDNILRSSFENNITSLQQQSENNIEFQSAIKTLHEKQAE